MATTFKRLIYSPKAYIFITSRTHSTKKGVPRVYDVSDYVVSGKVNRLLDQPSTAEFTLKNRFFEFSANNKNGPVFLPQDGVTIWLQRIAGRPIQVFTGYLDSVPYYQMYPGVATFKATCTLKRLQHVLFDPGLPATMQFMASNGWTVDPTNGAIIGSQFAEGLSTTGGHSNDAGFGVLLSKFMKTIAGWDPSAVWVSDLPADLARRTSDIYGSIWNQNQLEAASLEGFLKSLMSISVVNEAVSVGPPSINAVTAIKTAASKANIDPFLMVLSSLVLSGMYPFYKDSDPNDMGYGVGLFAATPDNQRNSNISPDQQDASNANVTYGGFSENDIMKLENAPKVFAKNLRTAVANGSGSSTILTNPNSAHSKDIAKLIADAANKTEYKAIIQESVNANWNTAKQFLGATATADPRVVTFWQIDTASTNDNVTWSDVTSLLSDTSLYTATAANTLSDSKYKVLQTNNNRMAAYLYVAIKDFGLIPHTYNGNGDGMAMLTRNGTKGDLAQYAAWVASQTTARGSVEIWSAIGGPTQYSKNGQALRNISTSPPISPTTTNDNDFIAIRLSNNSNPPDPPYYNGVPIFSATGHSNQNASNAQTDFTFEDLAKVDAATAFAARFALPVDVSESLLLTGDKSYMNDIPVLQAVQLIAGGSMRRFMSMPTGDFLAFYPDYFGADGRKPYWNIHDVEIINMGFNLSDDALATHVYVVGSTTNAADISYIERSITAGVITLEQIFNTKSFISGNIDFFTGKVNKTSKDKKGDFSTAVNQAGNIGRFFQIYGVRPYRKENPFIRSHWFEFLSALQTFMYLWTMQFATSVEFTFQPEIFAGGRVGFPEHGIECFVENVTHSWDYESGFTTSATLTSPVVTDKKRKKFPGFAITSGIGGQGVSTGM